MLSLRNMNHQEDIQIILHQDPSTENAGYLVINHQQVSFHVESSKRRQPIMLMA